MRAKISTFVIIILGCVAILVVWFGLVWRPMFSWKHQPKFDSSFLGKSPYDFGGGKSHYDFGGGKSHYDYGGGGYNDGELRYEGITKRQPPDIQKIVKPLIAELRKKSYDDLIILKSADNLCEVDDLIDCRGIEPKIVKQYVEAAFSHQQFIETTELRRYYNLISTMSMVISIFSVLFTGLTVLILHKKSSKTST